MGVVVRCPACRGASQVGPEGVGQLVACPRCDEPFLAVEEAAAVAPTETRRNRDFVPPPDPPRRRPRAEPVGPVGQHDPLHPPAGGLPLSVMIGLALLPFAIPLLWLAAPVVLPQPPALSVATPAALAVAAAALCLAVVFTIDWTPVTRLKGVLILVGMSYFVGLSLYFLKEEMIDRVKEAFGAPAWKEYRPDGTYGVKLPHEPGRAGDHQPLAGWKLTCYRASNWDDRDGVAKRMFMIGAGPDARPDDPPAAWFDAAEAALRDAAGDGAVGQPTDPPGDTPGRQWEVALPNNTGVRVVRVYREAGRVYYLAAEGRGVDPESKADPARKFFDSFRTNAVKK